MRLGQLARQVGVSPKEILRKLEDDFNVEIKAHPNAKIPDELLDELTKSFSHKVQTAEPEPVIKEEKVEPEEKKELAKKNISIVESVETGDTVEIEGPLEKIETEIPTLTGPKIVGKIEISEIELRRIAERNAERPDKPKRTKRPKKRPLEDKKRKAKPKQNDSLEEKRKRENKEIESKRIASAKSLKELNKKKYEEKTKSVLTKKAAQNPSKKKKKKKMEEVKKMEQLQKQPKKAKPTSLFGKMWSWLNDA